MHTDHKTQRKIRTVRKQILVLFRYVYMQPLSREWRKTKPYIDDEANL